MRPAKLVSVLFGSAAIALAAASSAADPPPAVTVTAINATSPTVAINEQLPLHIMGNGKCHISVRTTSQDGVVVSYEDSPTPRQLPTTVMSRPNVPGVYTVTVKTTRDPLAPNCAAEQVVSTTYTAFAPPSCPTGWERTAYDRFKGTIACTPYKPQLQCQPPTKSFYSTSTCNAGCRVDISPTATALIAPTGGFQPAPSGPIVPIGPINPCPSGWHLKAGTRNGNAFTCQPTKATTMMRCPAHTEYQDDGCQISCQANTL